MNNLDYYALKAIDNLANMISLTQDLIIKDLDSVPYFEANIDYYTRMSFLNLPKWPCVCVVSGRTMKR